MTQLPKLALSSFFAASLIACGGGGGDSSPNETTQNSPSNGIGPSGSAPSSSYTQADVQSVASKGVAATTFGATHVAIGLAYLGGSLMGFSGFVSGSLPTTSISCSAIGGTSGSYTFAFTKSAERAGFAVGDQVTLTYNNCGVFGGFVLNGAVTLTLQNSATNLPFSDYDIRYEAKFSGYSIRRGATTATYSGVANIRSNLVASNSTIQQMDPVPGQTVLVQGEGGLGVEYKSGSGIYVNEVVTPNTARYGLSGNVILFKDSKSTALLVSTPTLLAGSTASGRFVPTSGFVITKDNTLELATSASVSGDSISVTGSSSRNGSLDLSFSTNWLALVGP